MNDKQKIVNLGEIQRIINWFDDSKYLHWTEWKDE